MQPPKKLNKKSSSKLYGDVWNEIVTNKTNINTKLFNEYSKYYNPLFLLKNLHNTNENSNDGLIELGNAVNRKKSENENPDKIVEEILNFNEQQKGKGCPLGWATCFRILTPKQMFQRLPIALAQVQADNSSENLLNEFRQ